MKTIVDIGNTNTKYCLWSDEKGALASGKCPTSSALFQVIETELARLHPNDCPPFQWSGAQVVVSSVVPAVGQDFVKQATAAGASVLEISARTQTVLKGMSHEYGDDRVAEAVGAWSTHKVEGRPMVILGFGTATTLFTIQADGSVGGGFIGPGVKMLLTALSRDCALLPEVRLPDSVEEMNLGFTTESQMTGGVSLMFKGMVQEWLAKARSALTGEPVVVATGGYAAVVARLLPGLFGAVDQTLAIKGCAYLAGLAAAKTETAPAETTPAARADCATETAQTAAPVAAAESEA